MDIPQLPLPIAPATAIKRIIDPALELLPGAMHSPAAVLLILAIFLQESALAHRWQVVSPSQPWRKGPARGLGQFERGSRASRGGVWGVYLHPASRYWLAQVCKTMRLPFQPLPIWQRLETSDALAVVLSRLLLFTDPKALPAPGAEGAAWRYYLNLWRPGAYTRGTATERAGLRAKWRANYTAAMAAVAEGSA